MKARSSLIPLVVLLSLALGAAAAEKSVFLIGNSLTWDTVPAKLDGDVQWHVDCGKSLPYIHANPEKPCVKASTLWPKALSEKQYDMVSFQSHYGATLEEDFETISKWVGMQKEAEVVIHTGWARHATRAEEYASDATSGKMQHSQAYIRALLDKLRKRFPGRVFRQTHAQDLLAKVATDIEKGKAPFEKLEDIYRDAIHMNTVTGRYMMHNAMRHALGQSRSSAGFEKLDDKLKAYFDSVLDTLEGVRSRQVLSVRSSRRDRSARGGLKGKVGDVMREGFLVEIRT